MFKKGRSGHVEFTDTVADGMGDVLDTDYIEQGSRSGHGDLGVMDVSTEQTEAERTYSAVFNLGDVEDGDFISWDGAVVSGNTNGVFTLRAELAGQIAKRTYSKEADFLESKLHCNLNRIEEGFLNE